MDRATIENTELDAILADSVLRRSNLLASPIAALPVGDGQTAAVLDVTGWFLRRH